MEKESTPSGQQEDFELVIHNPDLDEAFFIWQNAVHDPSVSLCVFRTEKSTSRPEEPRFFMKSQLDDTNYIQAAQEIFEAMMSNEDIEVSVSIFKK